MPSDSHSYYGYYSDLIPHRREGIGGLVMSLVTNPFFSLRHALAPVKLLFLAKVFLPLLLLPLLARQGKVMMIYGLAFMLLATKDAVYSVHFQYPSILYPILFMLLPITLSELETSRLVGWFKLDHRRLQTGLMLAIVVSSLFVTFKFGGLVENDAFRSGWRRPSRTITDEALETYRWVEDTAAMIPPRRERQRLSFPRASHLCTPQRAHLPGELGRGLRFHQHEEGQELGEEQLSPPSTIEGL